MSVPSLFRRRGPDVVLAWRYEGEDFDLNRHLSRGRVERLGRPIGTWLEYRKAPGAEPVCVFEGDWAVVDGDGEFQAMSDTRFRRLYREA